MELSYGTLRSDSAILSFWNSPMENGGQILELFFLEVYWNFTRRDSHTFRISHCVVFKKCIFKRRISKKCIF